MFYSTNPVTKVAKFLWYPEMYFIFCVHVKLEELAILFSTALARGVEICCIYIEVVVSVNGTENLHHRV